VELCIACDDGVDCGSCARRFCHSCAPEACAACGIVAVCTCAVAEDVALQRCCRCSARLCSGCVVDALEWAEPLGDACVHCGAFACSQCAARPDASPCCAAASSPQAATGRGLGGGGGGGGGSAGDASLTPRVLAAVDANAEGGCGSRTAPCHAVVSDAAPSTFQVCSALASAPASRSAPRCGSAAAAPHDAAMARGGPSRRRVLQRRVQPAVDVAAAGGDGNDSSAVDPGLRAAYKRPRVREPE
jgi:hypothetical protein